MISGCSYHDSAPDLIRAGPGHRHLIGLIGSAAAAAPTAPTAPIAATAGKEPGHERLTSLLNRVTCSQPDDRDDR